jgi:hypothetical protein
MPCWPEQQKFPEVCMSIAVSIIAVFAVAGLIAWLLLLFLTQD